MKNKFFQPQQKVNVNDVGNSPYCHCESEEPYRFDDRDAARDEKRRLKEEKLRKKARKLKKKQQLEKECLSERIHCFRHDNEHWRTAPLWTLGPFCFCMNAINNTYNCVRTINSTHNFLYCEFVTGRVTYYNLRIDPFELENRYSKLKPEERSYLHDQLQALIACKGRSCTMGGSISQKSAKIRNPMPSQPYLSTQRYRNRKTINETVTSKY